MATGWEWLMGGTQQIGSPSDVKMLNQQGYENFMNQLGTTMGGFQAGMGSYLGQAGQQFNQLGDLSKILSQTGAGYGQAAAGFGSDARNALQGVLGTARNYTDFLQKMYSGSGQAAGASQAAQAGMGGAADAAGQQFGNVAGTAENLNNFIAQQGAQYGNLAQATGGFSPTAMMNQYLSTQPQLAQLANQNVSGALSDVYGTGRAQATAAANQARRQAAADLAASGLLGTGAGIGAMTEATLNPQLQMETQLAGMRSQALQNQLGQLQGQAGSMLNQGYGTAAQMAQQAQANQLAATGQQGQLYQAAGQGQQALANLYGQQALGQAGLAQGYTQGALGGAQGLSDVYKSAGGLAANLYNTAGGLGANYAGIGADALRNAAQGTAGIGNILASLYGQGLGAQATLNQPYYYTPQYSEQTGLGQRLGSAATGALSGAALGSIVPGIGTAIGAGIGGLAGLFV